MNNRKDKMENIQFKFTACSPPKCGCPDVEYDNGLVTIIDDFGGKAKLTMDDLEYIIAKTHNLIEHIREEVRIKKEAIEKEIQEKKAKVTM